MAICDHEYCDFIVYTPKGVHIERITKCTEYWIQLETNLSGIFRKFLLPELLLKSLSHDNDTDAPGDTICSCKRAVFGRVIKCSSDKCENKCYHYTCVGLKRKPVKEWTCANHK